MCETFVALVIIMYEKKIAIVQSSYIPWKGYFDLIGSVDEFILYDEMQFTRRDWRNRNLIKTPTGLHWLTVPVISKGKFTQKISETKIDGVDWAGAHWKTLSANYRRSKYFHSIADWLGPLYLDGRYDSLSELNFKFLQMICQYLELETKISFSSDYYSVPGKSARLAALCVAAGGGEYISGPSARDYLDEKEFFDRGLKIFWFSYDGYEKYPQQWGEFVHGVSILDLLFNCGPDSRKYMKLKSFLKNDHHR